MQKIINVSIVFITTITLLVIVSGCVESSKQKNNTLSREDVSELLEKIVQTPLPPKATKVFGHKDSVFTTIADIRFDCSENELEIFLKSSPVLLDTLTKGERKIVNTMSGMAWWQPDDLESISSSEQKWKIGTSTVSGILMVGKTVKRQEVTVYLSITIE